MTKKKIIIPSVIGALIFLTLAVVFFFYDLNISIALASDNLSNPNFFLKLCASIGEFPIYVGPMLFGLVYGLTNKTKMWQLIAHFVGFVCTYIGGVRMLGETLEVFFHAEMGLFHYSLLAIASLLTYLLFFILFSKIKVENLVKIRDIALIMLIVSAASLVGTQVVKHVVGRTRFRALDETYSEYTNFLTIKEFLGGLKGDDYKSFPSGHTGSAACIMMLTLIPMRFTNKKWMTYLVLALTGVYTITIAISRVCIGAHYASDVLFGFACTALCFIVTYFIFYKKGWLNARSN